MSSKQVGSWVDVVDALEAIVMDANEEQRAALHNAMRAYDNRYFRSAAKREGRFADMWGWLLFASADLSNTRDESNVA